MRKYASEDDYWRVRNFLRDVMLANDLREFSWHVARLDYARWHVAEVTGMESFTDFIFIWETDGGAIRAVLTPEGPGEAHLHVHPDHDSPELEADMLAVAEKHLAADDRLVVFTDSEHAERIALLERSGYTRSDWPEYQWRRDLDGPIDAVPVADGYTVRSLGGPEEIPARSWCSWRAFHPDDPDDNYDGYDWYPRNIQRQPLYRRDLDLVAVPDGQPLVIAAFATVWYDDATRTAYFEPVGTAPEHQRRGLSRAILTEGLRRVQALGCQRAFVGGYSEAANGLYRSVFSDAHDLYVGYSTRTRAKPS